MGGYDRRLDQLLQLTQAGAVDPGAATQSMWNLQDEQKAKRQEQRAAQTQGLQDSMGAFYGMAGTEAQQGTSLESLLDLGQTNPASAGVTQNPQLLAGLESLYFTNPESRNFGYSRQNPTLDPDDRAAILQTVRNSGGQPFEAMASQLHNEARNSYGPKVYAQLAPQIDEVLREAWDFGVE